MPPFVSTNGLAGDVVIIEGITSRRQIEISSLRDQIIELKKAKEKEIQAIEEDIKRTGPVIKRIEELQQLDDYDRSLIAPIRKLPAELLGYVFKYHVDLDNSPWVLTLVSRRWRHTAMATPSLWVNLLLYSAEYRRVQHPSRVESWRIDKSSWYSSGRRVVCHDLRELNTIITRAGSLPLDIHISYLKDNASVVRSVLGDTAVARRVASLSIDGASPLVTGSIHEVARVTIGSFPLLHSLTISLVSEKLQDEILESISSSSPHLKHFTIHHTYDSSLKLPFWSKLRSLNLYNGSTAEFLNNLVPHLGELEILEGCPPSWPDNFTPEITLARLTTLKVICSPEYLRKLRLPALLDLLVTEVSSMEQVETEGEPLISLPALEILYVDARTFLSWLAMLSAPSLRVFTLRQPGLSPLVDASFFQNIRFPSVQDFTLDYPCTGETAISALESVPNAERVAVSSMYPLLEEPWVLELLQHLADAENMLCPHMTHFTLGSPSNRAIVNKTSARAHARRAIKNRMDGGVKMDHFEIRFKAGGESVQYA